MAPATPILYTQVEAKEPSYLEVTIPVPTVITPVPTVPVAKSEVIDEVECNCWQYVKRRVPNLPNTKDIVPNVGFPVIGSTVIQKFKSGLMHYAIVEEIKDKSFIVSESNFHHCKYDTREISTDDPNIVGYFVVKLSTDRSN